MTPKLKIVETGTVLVVMKDDKPMCNCGTRQDARLIKMAVEEFWRINKKQSVTE